MLLAILRALHVHGKIISESCHCGTDAMTNITNQSTRLILPKSLAGPFVATSRWCRKIH